MYLMEHFKYNINSYIMTKIWKMYHIFHLEYNVKNVSKFPFVCSESEIKSENSLIISSSGIKYLIFQKMYQLSNTILTDLILSIELTIICYSLWADGKTLNNRVHFLKSIWHIKKSVWYVKIWSVKYHYILLYNNMKCEMSLHITYKYGILYVLLQ